MVESIDRIRCRIFDGVIPWETSVVFGRQIPWNPRIWWRTPVRIPVTSVLFPVLFPSFPSCSLRKIRNPSKSSQYSTNVSLEICPVFPPKSHGSFFSQAARPRAPRRCSSSSGRRRRGAPRAPRRWMRRWAEQGGAGRSRAEQGGAGRSRAEQGGADGDLHRDPSRYPILDGFWKENDGIYPKIPNFGWFLKGKWWNISQNTQFWMVFEGKMMEYIPKYQILDGFWRENDGIYPKIPNFGWFLKGKWWNISQNTKFWMVFEGKIMNMVVGWMMFLGKMMENASKMDHLGVAIFKETLWYIYIYILVGYQALIGLWVDGISQFNMNKHLFKPYLVGFWTSTTSWDHSRVATHIKLGCKTNVNGRVYMRNPMTFIRYEWDTDGTIDFAWFIQEH